MSLVRFVNLHRNFPMSVCISIELKKGSKKNVQLVFVFVCLYFYLFSNFPIHFTWWMFVSAEYCESRAKTCFCYKLKHKAGWTGLLHWIAITQISHLKRHSQLKKKKIVSIKFHPGDCPILYLCICICLAKKTHKLILYYQIPPFSVQTGSYLKLCLYLYLFEEI